MQNLYNIMHQPDDVIFLNNLLFIYLVKINYLCWNKENCLIVKFSNPMHFSSDIDVPQINILPLRDKWHFQVVCQCRHVDLFADRRQSDIHWSDQTPREANSVLFGCAKFLTFAPRLRLRFYENKILHWILRCSETNFCFWETCVKNVIWFAIMAKVVCFYPKCGHSVFEKDYDLHIRFCRFVSLITWRTFQSSIQYFKYLYLLFRGDLMKN